MDLLWKWIMRLNAKAFCLLAVTVFFATVAWCGFQYQFPPKPFQHGDEKPQTQGQAWDFGTLAFVSNQLAESTLIIPTDPFRPTLEAIFTNDAQRAAFIDALKAAQARANGLAPADPNGKKVDPFANIREKTKVPDGLVDAKGNPMVVPKLSFLGFVQRPDGTKSAMFHDSVDNTTVFYESGNKIHGVDILDADVREANIRFADGTTRKLEIGGSVDLAPEPDKRPPKPAAKPPAKPDGKPGKPDGKPGAKPPAKQKP
ncbi:MAG: hypothetical protein LBW77_03885 [Verrucomicrobiota bacterium]|nr:hypothetical protein [Verrucomicrobiota bacterium]